MVRFRPSALAAAALALVAAPASAQSLFEGKISMTMHSPRGSIPVEMYLKDGVSRTDMSGPGGNSMVMINDPAKKEMLMLMPERQMYMRRSTDMANMPQMDGGQGAPPKPTITKTGKKDNIAGTECEWVSIEMPGGDKDEACLASGMGTFSPAGGGGMMGGGRGMGGGGGGGGGGRGPGGPGGGQAMGWARGLDRGMFPLKVTKNGETVMEVTKIEKKKVDPTLFTVPDGFQEMGAGMMGGRGRPPQD